ncbi:MAG: haloalkane dehalogenase [Pseudomonadota bacterium]
MKKFILLAAATALAASLSACLQALPVIAPKAKNVEANISTAFPFERRFVEVNGARMAYVEAGDPNGAPILLVHGNPTNAYLWRNIIPHLEDRGRVIAVELIGMGGSDKPDIAYRFAEHAEYFQGFIEVMNLKDIVLVLHDWGGGLGLDYAARHPDNVRGLAFMEAVMMPMSLKDADPAARFIFSRFRDPDAGYKINAEDNYFVEKLLPMMAGRDLSEAEMAAYRAPFPTERSRRPVAQWPFEIPLDGAPADNVKRIGDNFEWLRGADTPLLLVYAEPGMIMRPKIVDGLRRDLPRMETAFVGSGLHYIQETQPTKIGEALDDWINRLQANPETD